VSIGHPKKEEDKDVKMIKMCLNWKVLAALAAVGAGVFAVAPNLALAALPILLVAVCPLSMLFMMKGMQGQQAPLNDRIDELEQTESRSVENGRGR
jgi:hypothetical protein